MGAFQYGGIVEQVATTATAAGTSTFTNVSKQIQIFTGSSAQTIVLPDATTMSVGQKFEIYNESSSSLLVNFNGGAAFTDAAGIAYGVLLAHTALVIKLQTNGTAAGTWAVLSTASTATGTGINYIAFGTAEAGLQNWHTLNWEQTVTITNASPAVFAVTSTTGMYVGMPISFTTTGALPTGLTASTTYFVSNVLSGTTFRVSATLGGADLNTSSAGSGTHTSYPLVPINDTTVALTNLTFSTSASSPLVGSNSYTLVQTNSKAVGGEGVGYDFTIDSGYKAQMLGISFNYNASSTFVASSGAVNSDSDIEVAIWDKTNGVLIPVTPKTLTANGSNNFTYSGSFQTAANSTSYALILYTPTMNANATGWTFKFDNVQVGPIVNSSSVGVVAAVVSGTPAAFAANAPIIFPTVISDNTASYSATTGRFTAPVSGYYHVDALVNDNNHPAIMSIYKNGTLYVNIGFGGVLTETGQPAPSAGSGIVQANAGDLIDVRRNQSSSAISSGNSLSINLIGGGGSSLGSGAVIALIVDTGPSSYTANTACVYTNVVKDTNAGYNVSTGRYTVQVAGFYEVSAAMNTTTTGAFTLEVYVNGSDLRRIGERTTGAVNTLCGTVLLYCNVGDIIDTRGSLTSSLYNSPSMSWMTIAYLPGGSSNANNLNSTVSAKYYGATAFTPAGAVVAFPTKDFDTHNAFNTSTNLYTVPVSGKYKITSSLLFTSTGGLGPSQGVFIVSYKNSIKQSLMGAQYDMSTTTAASTVPLNGSDTLQCNAGDTIAVFGEQDGGSTKTTLSGATTLGTKDNFILIEKVGN